MPFKSDAQRRFMYARHPRIAARWSEHTPKGKDLPERVGKKSKLKKKGSDEMTEEKALQILLSGGLPTDVSEYDDPWAGISEDEDDPDAIMDQMYGGADDYELSAVDFLRALQEAAAKRQAEQSELPDDLKSERKSGPVKKEALLAAVNLLTKSAATKSKSKLQKLDEIGVGRDALNAYLNQDFRSVWELSPLLHTVKQRKEIEEAERQDRIRRLKEEFFDQTSHLDDKLRAAMFGEDLAAPGGPAGTEGPSSIYSPAAPGSPQAPSNHLGMSGGGGPAVSLADAVKGMGNMGGNGNILDLFTRSAAAELGMDKESEDEEDKKAAFKYGFWKKAAEAGIMPSELDEMVKGAAGSLIGDILGKGIDVSADVAKLMLMFPLLAGPAAGAGMGTAAYAIGREPDLDPEELRHLERLALYRRLTREAKRRTKKNLPDIKEEQGETQPDDAHNKILSMPTAGGIEI